MGIIHAAKPEKDPDLRAKIEEWVKTKGVTLVEPKTKTRKKRGGPAATHVSVPA